MATHQSTHTLGTRRDSGIQAERTPAEPNIRYKNSIRTRRQACKNLRLVALVKKQKLANFLVNDDAFNDGIASVWKPLNGLEQFAQG